MPRIKPPRAHNSAPLPERQDFTPPTEDIEIDLAEEPGGPSEVDLAAPPAPEPEPAPAATPAPAPATAPDDDALVRAAEAQRQAEEIARNAQRERDEAIRQAQAHQQELERERTEREDADYNTVLTSLAAEQRRLEAARAAIRSAKAAGDTDAEIDAVEQMTDAKAQISQFELAKKAFETRRETRPAAPSPQPQPTPPAASGVEQQIANMPIPETAKSWLRGHQDYLTDPRKNAKLQAAHWDALDDAGGQTQMGSAKYIESLEMRLGLRQSAPPEPGPEPTPQPAPQQRTMPMRAPVSREVPTASGQRAPSSRITLTPEERQIARISFTAPDLTDAQKEYLYAQNKQRLAKMRANGEYPQPERN